MPIRPELCHHYRGPAWRATRARILARAKNRCEQCGKPNHARIQVYNAQRTRQGNPVQYWRLCRGQVWRCSPSGRRAGSAPRELRRPPSRIRVVLTIAHLNHTPGDDRPENLKALCQWCHLWHDRNQHRATRAQTKDTRRPLLHPLITRTL